MGFAGSGKGPNLDQAVQAVSEFKEEVLLGQSFLVKRVLC